MLDMSEAAGFTDRQETRMAEPTTYIVLRFNPETDEWAEHGDRVSASSAPAAIREHVSRTNPALIGSYVAVPARSWKPVLVRAIQTTVLKIEDASKPTAA